MHVTSITGCKRAVLALAVACAMPALSATDMLAVPVRDNGSFSWRVGPGDLAVFEITR